MLWYYFNSNLVIILLNIIISNIMRETLIKLFVITSLLMIKFTLYSQQLAFPGAEGFGKYAVGGRYGSVYKVTNLNDSGAGSFRDAVSQPNRIVVFDVAGVIKINSRIVIKNNIYIAGQTAPGEGITIYGNSISLSGANNVIVRHLRVRMGAIGNSGQDAFTMANGKNMIFDHVSIAWGRDETLSVTSECENVTIQNSIVSQGLLPHSAGSLIEPAGGITIYRTLYINNDTRSPKFKLTHQFVNNIVYNWKSAAYIMGGNSNARSYANAVGNYFITGPAGSTSAFSGGNDRYSIYAEDNWVDKNRNGILDGNEIPHSEYSGGPNFVTNPFDHPELPTISAQNLFDDLVGSVGASLPYRDNLDWMLIDDLKSFGTKGKIIGNENELIIGAPNTWNLWQGNSRLDTDGDGIPDEWEVANGLDPNDPTDAMQIRDGYANIEHYINSITSDNSQFFLKAPSHLISTKTTQNEISLEWLDYTDFEDGYIIEQKIDGAFAEIARVGKNVNKFFIESLEPETTYFFRVKGFNSEVETSYTNELEVKTRPIPVNALDPESFTPDLTWIAGNSGNWNYSDESWDNGKFEDGNSILFNEVGGSSVNVFVTEEVVVGDVVFKGDANYTFSGSAIAGDGSVNKTGKGVLSLGVNNKYSGTTVIWDGVLKIGKLANGGQPSSIGASENYDFNWVWNGGKIEYTGGTVTTNRNVALENATEFSVNNASTTVTIDGVIAGEGDFIKSGPGKFYSTFGKHTYSGNTIVKEGVYELRGNYADVGLKGKLILDGGTFRTVGGADGKDGVFNFPIEVVGENKSYFEPTRNSKIMSKFSGSGDLHINVNYLREFYTGNWDEYYGNLTINANGYEFMLSTSIPNAKVHLTNGAIKAGKNSMTITLGALSGAANASLVCSHVKTAGGSATYKIGSMNTDEDFHGVISSGVTHDSRKGRSNIVKEGDGYWRLTNSSNRYLGTTTINEGTLIVNGKHITDKDWDANGNHSPVIPGAYTINDKGTLAGTGNILTTRVTVKNGGSISPGDINIANFTVEAPVAFESGSSLIVRVDKTSNRNGRLIVKNSSLSFNGDVHMFLEEGEYEVGDIFVIFSASSYTGQVGEIYPETPGSGLLWDTSELLTRGRIKVVENSTNIKDVFNKNINISYKKDGILVTGLENTKSLVLYDTQGNIIINESVSYSEKWIKENPGVYFLKVDKDVFKIILR